MLIEKIIEAATPALEKRTIKDLIVGLTLIACELDNGAVGISYVLREGLPHGCSRYPWIKELIGAPALQAMDLAIQGTDNIQRGIANSVLNAASQQLVYPNQDSKGVFGLDLMPEDRVAMIGYIGGLAKQITATTDQLIIFDKGLSEDGEQPFLSPMDRQTDLIPTCNIVLISGTAIINNSIDGLLALSSRAKEVVIMGPSTPMFPDGYQDTPVTRLAGAYWQKGHKAEIFRTVSLAGGHKAIDQFMVKKLVSID